jgi:HK97 gp10 family phage protein
MNQRGTTFRFDVSAIENLGRNLGKGVAMADKMMEARMTAATNLVFRIAHQRRPQISIAQAKQESRWNPYVYRIAGTKKYKRVSDPNAELGVPVDTGVLQSAIQKKVTRSGSQFVGEVWVDTAAAPYARDIEYGTDRIRARPFMRPAINLTQDQIKQLFSAKATLQ